MAKHSTALSRLKQDFVRLKKDPVPFIEAEPIPSNMLEWHYIVRGPESSPYHGGLYHGKLKFPAEFPFKPPSIYMITPSGRFKVNTRLCLSISDFHPDTWNPAWSVGTILTGLLSFMLEKSPTLGSLETTDSEKRSLAYKSIEFNLKDKLVHELFPEIYEEMKQIVATREKNAKLSVKAPQDPLNNNHNKSKYTNNSSTLSSVLVVVGFAVFVVIVFAVLNENEI